MIGASNGQSETSRVASSRGRLEDGVMGIEVGQSAVTLDVTL